MRHHGFHEATSLLVDLRVIDQDLADIAAQVVAQGANDHVGFLVDQYRRFHFLLGLLNGRPDSDQVVQVPLQFFHRSAYAGGAHDAAHALRDVHLRKRFTHLVAIVTLDTARHATGARVVRHQYEEPAGEADEGGQGSTLVATLFLFDLDQHFLAFLQHILDVDLAAGITAEIAAGDFLEGQEAMAFGTVVDKGRFQRRLDAGDAALVDIGFFLFAGGELDIEIVKSLAIDQRNAQLFGLRCIDKHSFHCRSCWHSCCLCRITWRRTAQGVFL